VFAYEAIMAIVFFFALFFLQAENSYTTTNIYSRIINLYPVLAITQLVILGVVVPIRTASSISGEKERQTFDIMMTTSMTPFSIIAGKVTTAVIQGMFFVIAGMPIMALTFVIGGVSWSYLFWFMAIAVLVSIFSASIGICCSAMSKRSVTAVIMSYGFYVIFFLGTLIPVVSAAVVGYCPPSLLYYLCCGICLINPAVYLVEFFVWMMMERSPMFRVLTQSTTTVVFGIDEAVLHGIWMTISTILFLLISVGFLVLAAKRISPISRKTAKKLAEAGQRVNENG
jgi:ABC-type transport system involved in multi-copper enzyme maturation permease subunit